MRLRRRGGQRVGGVAVVSGVKLDDVVRLVVVVEAVLVGAAMLAVLHLYVRAWRLVPDGRGVLPAYVALMAASYGAIAWMLGLGILEATAPNWRAYGYGIALAVGLVALWLVGGRQRRRVKLDRRRRLHVDLDVEPTDSEGRP